MATSANIAIFGPDAKWRAIDFKQALNRSCVFHAGIGLTLIVLAVQAATMPHRPETNYINIEFVVEESQPVLTATTAGVRSAYLVPNNANRQKNDPRLGPQTGPAAPAQKPALAANAVPTPVENAVPKPISALTTNRSSAAAPEINPRAQSPSNRLGPTIAIESHTAALAIPKPSEHQAQATASTASSPSPTPQATAPANATAVSSPNGIGSPNVGSPAPTAPSQGGSPQLTMIQGVNTAGIARFQVGERPDPSVPNYPYHVLAQRSPAISINGLSQFMLSQPDQTFLELDAQACRIFYQAEDKSMPRTEAEPLYRRAIAIMDTALPLLKKEMPQENVTLAEALYHVGSCYERLSDLPVAETYYKQASDVYKRVCGKDSKEWAISLVYYGDILKKEHKYTEAEAAFKDSLPGYQAAYGAQSELVRGTFERLSSLYYATNRPQEAENANKLASQCHR